MILKKIIKNKNIKKISNNFYTLNTQGYWSNLSYEENKKLVSDLKKHSTRKLIKQFKKKNLNEVIFSQKRHSGLDLLNLKGFEKVLDFGCMWGALTIPIAKKTKIVLGIDQTKKSLLFLEKRTYEEKLKNIHFLQANLRDIELTHSSFDIAIVNGVLEWIAETNEVVVDDYLNKKNNIKNEKISPGLIQKKFLQKIVSGLKKNGKLYLAIENRYDYKMFFGLKDPHNGTYFTTIFPKFVSNIISLIVKRRPYRTWIYSVNELKKILDDLGFGNISLYTAWPDYRLPDQIIPYQNNLNNLKICSAYKNSKITWRKKIAGIIEYILFKKLNLKFLSPSLIFIAVKK